LATGDDMALAAALGDALAGAAPAPGLDRMALASYTRHLAAALTAQPDGDCLAGRLLLPAADPAA
jgi:hypothetical protein